MYEYDETGYFSCRVKPALTSFEFHRCREMYGPARSLGAELLGNFCTDLAESVERRTGWQALESPAKMLIERIEQIRAHIIDRDISLIASR